MCWKFQVRTRFFNAKHVCRLNDGEDGCVHCMYAEFAMDRQISGITNVASGMASVSHSSTSQKLKWDKCMRRDRHKLSDTLFPLFFLQQNSYIHNSRTESRNNVILPVYRVKYICLVECVLSGMQTRFTKRLTCNPHTNKKFIYISLKPPVYFICYLDIYIFKYYVVCLVWPVQFKGKIAD